jgi:hypothetical protein
MMRYPFALPVAQPIASSRPGRFTRVAATTRRLALPKLFYYPGVSS